MDLLQVVCLLRPGTTWNLRAGVLEQAIDDAPRVAAPTQEEIDNKLAELEQEDK